ncbi:ATP-binding cassette, subfamily B (MDR/TAP), member 1 [Blastomyces parvus]|uniref:ATP-binding cassette, subfamily B (MDR/TAP), member 1 n=1 Tax=Blastomyces parvus TaxID=2060905 RepID=A0A2B7XN94_9EURO|nr:ATP-binding cassette, subfamily B (MDR/TAP), member 1 [Blastomyces parvus]
MEIAENSPNVVSTGAPAPKPKWTSLFHFTSRKHVIFLLFGSLFTIGAGVLVPLLAVLLGRVFGAFARFGEGSLTPTELIHAISAQCVYFLALGILIWLLQTGHFSFWMAFGELQAKSARERSFIELLKKDIPWFEMRQEGVSALLPRLQVQIQDLQLATSQPLGCVLQRVVTFATALILALYTSWKLTLVSLASVPICAAVVAVISRKIQPCIQAYEAELTRISKLISNCFSCIDAVKYFNGQNLEVRQYSTGILSASRSYRNEAFGQALQIGCVRLMIFGMFVQGFWYGISLVETGQLTPGDVVATFWACLQSTQAVEDILPHIIVLEKGRTSSSALQQLVEKINRVNITDDASHTVSPRFCEGDICIKNVTFAYPSRPDCYVLKNSSFFFPAGDTTYIVGRSGSGKSTLSNLLMRFYAPTSGGIFIDGTPLQNLHIDWIRNNITLVQQQSFLFNETLIKNIAFGSRDYQTITEDKILACLRFASLDEMVRNLPDGLDTIVGVGGSAFSGGQRQRVAIARARLRDTPILILDETTSALDFTSRSTVMDAIRAWRKGKTTIVITHDMSQINDQDFMYVLHQGQVVRKGYKQALEQQAKETFGSALAEVFDFENERSRNRTRHMAQRGSRRRKLKTTTKPLPPVPNQELNLTFQTFSLSPISPNFHHSLSFQSMTHTEQTVQPLGSPSDRYRQTHPRTGMAPIIESIELNGIYRESKPDTDLSLIQTLTCTSAAGSREFAFGDDKWPKFPGADNSNENTDPKRWPMLEILRTVIPCLTLRCRFFLAAGFVAALVHAAATPVFAYLFAQLLGAFFLAGDRVRMAVQWSLEIIGVSVANGVASFVMHFLLEYCGQAWINCLRNEAVRRILSQPKEWFEKEENKPSNLTMCLDRNAEEMRNLVGRFAGFLFVATVTMVMCIAWGISVCWKLTLVGIACAPIVYSITRAFERVSSKWEKTCNDSVAMVGDIFSETFLDLKTVRALTLESHFHKKLDGVLMNTLTLGLKRACFSGFFFGLTSSSIIFVYTLVFYYGAVLASSLEYSTKDILTVFSLLLFSLSNVNAALEYVPQISSSRDTACRVLRLATLPNNGSHEDEGTLKTSQPAPLKFTNVNFSYPSRPKKLVLRNLNLTIAENSCTAIVGPSGSGKSTIASLLTALYPITSSNVGGGGGTSTISLGGDDIRNLCTQTLRSLLSIVPQQPTLFSSSIRANITYGLDGSSPLSTMENIRSAAQAAGIDEFIMSLPEGYDTIIGDGGLSMSGGQAQRVVIARALVRRPRILILDEATSNLDAHSVEQIRRTVKGLLMGSNSGQGLTVIIITHAVEMMEIADKIVVVDKGCVVEEGPFLELMARKGGELRRLVTLDGRGRDGL